MSYPQSLSPPAMDFVRSDFAALTFHMEQCASAQGRWSATRGHLQNLRALAAGRIVTLACAAVIIGIGLAIAA
ncbi:MAG: hypothetical protein KKC79_11900 [Gammaproteobacteria bacterium]|nr:hypothetical protein [Gammaproteobacteria bacterium]MBU1443105.1 hypothetical protein [Gammaproteobacteria bacterium]MBU2409333.1 hypothetical protein [Gammaproteobacteria bacterium]